MRSLRLLMFAALAVFVTVSAAAPADAGLLAKLFGKCKKSKCCPPPACCEPEPTCCEPEPTCCEPEPAPCADPCAPAPSDCGCSGEVVVESAVIVGTPMEASPADEPTPAPKPPALEPEDDTTEPEAEPEPPTADPEPAAPPVEPAE